MAPLAHQRSAARMSPDPVQRRRRTAVPLATVHPEDLGFVLLDDLALLLHGGRVDPVLRIAEDHATPARGLHDAIGAGEGVSEQRLLAALRAEGAGKWLLDEDVLSGL